MKTFPPALPYRIALLSFAAFIFVFMYLHDFSYTMDDAFISFRYAQNLASGHGLVWNPGETPVEGYTNFLWVMVLTAAIKAGVDVVLAAKLLALLSGLAVIVILERLAVAFTGGESALSALPSLIYASAPFTPFHAAEGLETTMYTLIIVSVVFAAVKSVSLRSCRWFLALCVLILLAGLTRPEGVLFGLALLAVIAVRNRKLVFTKRGLLILAVTGLAGFAYFAWRWSYFGHLLPNPFYLKHPGGLLDPQGLKYVGSFVLIYCTVPLILALVHMVRRRTPSYLVLLLVPVAVILLFYLGVNPVMGTAHRYLAPYFPLVLLIMLPVHRGFFPSSPVIVPAGAALAMIVIFMATFSSIDTEAREYGRGMNRANIPLGKALNAVFSEPERQTLACGDAGAIPFYSGFRTIDLIGLNDVRTVREGFSADRVMRQSPDVLVLYSKNGLDVATDMGHDRELVSHPRFGEYTKVGALLFNRNYYLMVLARKDLPEIPALKKALEEIQQ
ncbi:MAG: hypothetical protein GXO82_03845 [Chlorobi bacterium]|nr:hypothetical protein [Chlorobiota bacterium]